MMHQIQQINKNYINKRASVGLTILNSGVNTSLVAKARSNPKPLYDKPLGADATNQNEVNYGEIVFTEIAPKNAIRVHARETSGLNGAHHKAFGISRLGGQGLRGQDNEMFMSTIKPLGFCERSNSSNAKGLFPIAMAGIMTVTNNGIWNLHVGDRVMAHAPSQEELKIARSKGNSADQNGDVQLWLKPYDPEKNKLTTRPILRCLRRKSTDGYTQTYTDATVKLMEAVRELSLPVLWGIYDKLPLPKDAAVKKVFFTELFKELNNTKNHKAIEDSVFAAHVDERGLNNWIEPLVTAPLHKAQAEAIDKFLLYSSYHYHTIVDRNVGTIVSEAKVDENVDILIGKYSL